MSTLTLAALQCDIYWLDKRANLRRLEQMIAEQLPKKNRVDLLLLPETFATGFCIDNEEAEEGEDGGTVLVWLKKMASQYNCVVAGSVLVSQEQKKVNRFYWVFADGSVEYYDKRHLFRLGNEQEHVAQGQDRKIISINGIKILPLVCYDLRFPVWSRNRQDYDLMVNVANWPAPRRHVWDTLLKARAMENQCYVVGVNRVGNDGRETPHSGGTAIIDFSGQSIVSAPDNRQQVVTATLDFSELDEFKRAFPAYLDADEFELH